MKALKRLNHRNWDTLRDLWISHVPSINFNASYPEPTLSQLPSIAYPPLGADGTCELPYVPGVREAIFREALAHARKSIYCCALLPMLSNAGRNTWTSVATYDGCFYGAKAFCALLGFASLGRDSKLFIDAFAENERKIGKRKEKVYDTLKIHQFKDRLTHEILWNLTARLVDTTKFDDTELNDIQIQLKLLEWEKFSAFRNKVMYDVTFWPLQENMENCDLISSVRDGDFVTASLLESGSASTAFAEEYFVAAALFRKVIVGMLDKLAEIAPALAQEADAFRTLQYV